MPVDSMGNVTEFLGIIKERRKRHLNASKVLVAMDFVWSLVQKLSHFHSSGRNGKQVWSLGLLLEI